ncbi:hypothetical protein D8S78_22125 [Natrialba swarupiae]|nr:hypothetical protein [Natrialba swarupiae]
MRVADVEDVSRGDLAVATDPFEDVVFRSDRPGVDAGDRSRIVEPDLVAPNERGLEFRQHVLQVRHAGADRPERNVRVRNRLE